MPKTTKRRGREEEVGDISKKTEDFFLPLVIRYEILGKLAKAFSDQPPGPSAPIPISKVGFPRELIKIALLEELFAPHQDTDDAAWNCMVKMYFLDLKHLVIDDRGYELAKKGWQDIHDGKATSEAALGYFSKPIEPDFTEDELLNETTLFTEKKRAAATRDWYEKRLLRHKKQLSVADLAVLEKHKKKFEKEVNSAVKRVTQKNTSGCFVATVIFKSKEDPNVIYLRKFRDETMSNYFCGRIFISLYSRTGRRISNLLQVFPSWKVPLKRLILSVIDQLMGRIPETK